MALTEHQQQLLMYAKKAALELGENDKRLTDLIGELSACDYLNLTWKPSDGYDSLTESGKRVQIKSRKSWTTDKVNPSGRLNRFGRKAGYQFDKGIFVELDQRFEVSNLWEMDQKNIEELERREAGGKGLHVSTFRSHARRLWPH